MKKLKHLFLFSAVCVLFLSSFGASSVKAQPGATFERMWVDYNIKQNDEDGMRIHLKFTTRNLKSTDCQIRIVFYYDTETPLKDKNQRYYTTTGNVAVFRDLKPAYDPAAYNDFQIFMPYNELDLPYGEYNLKMDVDLIYKDGELIQHLTWYDFTYSKKAPTTTTTTKGSKPSAVLDRLWIEYDVTEDGQFGMRIHAKFTVSNMKGISGYLAVFFERENGTRLKSYDNKYQSKAQDVAVYRSIKPAYDPAEYADLAAFIPYSELHLTKGEHNLRVDADLIYENGEFIQHLGYEKFRYWKQ
jgi:hypothetical protein